MAGQETAGLGATRRFRVAELGAYLSYSPRHALSLDQARPIASFRIGSDYRFDRAAIEQCRRSQQFPDPASAAQAP